MFLYGKKLLYWKFFLLRKNFFTEKNINEIKKYTSFEKYIFIQKMFVLHIKYKSLLDIYSAKKKLIMKNIFKTFLWTQ